MIGFRRLNSLPCALAALAAAVALPAPAAAQYMPHLDPNLYMFAMMNYGTSTCGPMVDSEIDEARLPAPGIMQAYFDAAQAGEPISPSFKLNKRTRWVLGEASAGQAELDAQRDPLAAAGNRLDPETLRFFRAGIHTTAQGQWLVLAPDGGVAGVYTAQFEREEGQWKLLALEIARAGDRVSPIKHYCSEPGDLVEAQVKGREQMVAGAERAFERAQRNHAKAEQTAAASEAKAAEKPDSSSRAQRAAADRAKAEERRQRLEREAADLAEANAKLAEARAELAEFQALTTEARNARSFRELDKDGKKIGQGQEG